MRQLVLVIALFVALGYSQPTIKRDWVQVNNGTAIPEGKFYAPPRAASFSDGRYIIVYTIATTNSESLAVGQIFNADGSIAKAEFELDSSQPTTYIFSAPNVVVFNDDTFLVVFRQDSQPTIWARRFNADGTPAAASFLASDDQNYAMLNFLEDGVELVGFADKSFAILYFSSVSSCVASVAHDSTDSNMWSFCAYVTEMSVAGAIVGDRARTTSYMAIESVSIDINLVQATPSFSSFKTIALTPDNVQHPAEPAIALTGNILTTLYSLGDSISFASTTLDLGLIQEGVLFSAVSGSNYSAPAIVGLNDVSTFIAYRYANISDNSFHLAYHTGTYSFNGELTAFSASPIQYSIASDLHYLRFVPMLGGDLLVVAKNPLRGDIWQQVLTFCGNGQLELNEECDGGANCGANCRCLYGLTGYQGTCGLPNVVPVLDCVETSNNGYNLHFSFINEDSVVQTLQHGNANLFTPSTLATDRPQQFAVGSTLTYPLSPYVTTIPTTVTQINWVLGSYNLTVDLTNITAVLCPTSLGFVEDVITPGYLDNGNVFGNNFARRYNISVDRLTTEAIQTAGPLPAKRATNYNRYDVIVTIAPANETEASEPTPAEAVQSAVGDYKRNSTEVDEDLLQGYDPNTNIKNITPTPTGVEVRGNRYDSSPSPPASPVASPTAPPVSNTPIAVSGSNTIGPQSLIIFAATILYSFIAN